MVSNGSGKVAVSAVTSTELGYLDGVSSAIQTQLNAKQATLSEGAFADGDKTKLDSVATNADVSPWTLSSGDVYRSSGNVGIGTIPSHGLDISGRIFLRTSDVGTAGIWYANTSGSGHDWFTGSDASAGWGWYYGAWLHILKPDGKVGFGTTDPKSNLSIDCAGSGDEGIFLKQTSGSGSSWLLYPHSTNGLIIQERESDFTFTRNVLSIDNGGNVGIGYTDPSYKLSVEGAINASGSIRTSQNIQFAQGGKRMYYNASNTTHMELRPHESVEGSFQYYSAIISKGLTKSGSGSTNSWSLTGSNPGTSNQWGQSSIFVASRAMYFNVYAASSDPGSWSNSQLYSNSNRMYINSSGDVYIRTNLTVTGSVTENSDSRAKKNQQLYDTSNCLYAIKNIPILTYDYEPWFKTETYDYIPNPNDPSGADIINPSAVNLPRSGVVGFIAQDLLNYPATQGTVKKNRATFIDASDNSYQFDDFHRVSKSRLIAVLMGAIQEQQNIIDAEKAKTATLESQVADLLSRVTALENT